ncbi:MAG: hypothetical protein AAGE18_05190 [Pseudomonadota bacterium]
MLRSACVLALGAGLLGAPAFAEDIAMQTNFPPMQVVDAPRSGAHPLGGLAMLFIEQVNRGLAPHDKRLTYHVSGEVPESDRDAVAGPVADMDAFATTYAAVAAGRAGGGVDLGIGIANQNGLELGELYVAALPFGLEADEFAAYLYDGGGLALQQEIYARRIGDIVVLPIAMTMTQGGGWFPEALPDPTADGNTPLEAMRTLCEKPWIVRWPEPGAGIWGEACAEAGVAVARIGQATRCEQADRPCPTDDNPLAQEIDRLTFGGFVPGLPPHGMIATGNIDAYELNLPSTEILMIKAALGQGHLANAEADLTPVVSAAPYYYGQTWHQQVTYLELLIHRPFWEGLSEEERWIIETAAEAATLRSLTQALALQGPAIARLEQAGAKVGRWPDGLLQVLRGAAERYLSAKAARLEGAGDADYARVLAHMRAYQQAQAAYADFGDLNQGRAGLPTSP